MTEEGGMVVAEEGPRVVVVGGISAATQEADVEVRRAEEAPEEAIKRTEAEARSEVAQDRSRGSGSKAMLLCTRIRHIRKTRPMVPTQIHYYTRAHRRSIRIRSCRPCPLWQHQLAHSLWQRSPAT
jgi:hypothetical protein